MKLEGTNLGYAESYELLMKKFKTEYIKKEDVQDFLAMGGYTPETACMIFNAYFPEFNAQPIYIESTKTINFEIYEGNFVKEDVTAVLPQLTSIMQKIMKLCKLDTIWSSKVSVCFNYDYSGSAKNAMTLQTVQEGKKEPAKQYDNVVVRGPIEITKYKESTKEFYKELVKCNTKTQYYDNKKYYIILYVNDKSIEDSGDPVKDVGNLCKHYRNLLLSILKDYNDNGLAFLQVQINITNNESYKFNHSCIGRALSDLGLEKIKIEDTTLYIPHTFVGSLIKARIKEENTRRACEETQLMF